MPVLSPTERLDAIINRRVSEEEAALKRDDAAREETRRQRQQANSEARREVAERYTDSFRSFGVEVPMALDDEPVARYRARLFNRLVRRLPEGHEWGGVRADDVPVGQALDVVERLVIEASKREGERPSASNLPDIGEVVRTRIDPMTNERSIEFFSKRSFIADMGRPGRRVLRFLNPRTGDVLFGPAFDRAR